MTGNIEPPVFLAFDIVDNRPYWIGREDRYRAVPDGLGDCEPVLVGSDLMVIVERKPVYRLAKGWYCRPDTDQMLISHDPDAP